MQCHEHWQRHVLPDLAQYFHYDADDEEFMAKKSWRWLRNHLLALLDIDESRMRRMLTTK